MREGPCFICAMLSGAQRYRHHVLYANADTAAFLSRVPTMPDYSIVAPRRHVESRARDLSEAEFLAFQPVIRMVAITLEAVLPTERMYSLSLGSQQGNSHLHWPRAPLPSGVPYEQQQYYALMAEHGVLDVNEQEQSSLAVRIGSQLPRPTGAGATW